MSLLTQYEQQYASLIAEITGNVGRLNLQSGHRRELCVKIETELSEAQELLEQMELEISDLSSAQRPSFTSKLNCAQAELKRLQNDYRNAKDKRAANTVVDLGAASDADYYDDVPIAIDQRQRLLDNSERLERTGNRLTEGYRIALETEQLGTQVLNDLHHQRETINSARSRVRETNADLGRASRTLNYMMVRALREKAVLYCVGVFFVAAVVLSLYLTFAPSSTES
ncbi:vesicle transport through interaction with t-SNAREs homolog 1A isoform X2 [Teleopsis dalmanni]|uniref:vesicle transport through interaction with t-SNAREs homolog 1A isoform X2 n=1 Tax=Teleopsis dalmanni TaxID=139649 RepID=UPI0018CCA4EA|nr:vesicle transport through interaction with t-SNAREs homolog 1A isoform X2 [Teleopsis dalmanni]